MAGSGSITVCVDVEWADVQFGPMVLSGRSLNCKNEPNQNSAKLVSIPQGECPFSSLRKPITPAPVRSPIDRIAPIKLSSVGGRRFNRLADHSAECHVGIQVAWFFEITADPQFSYFVVVFRRIGRADHDDRNVFAVGILPDLPEHFRAINFREIQIEKNDIDAWQFTGFSHALNELQGLFPVLANVKFVLDPMLIKRLLHEKNIPRIILDQKNLDHSRPLVLKSNDT